MQEMKKQWYNLGYIRRDSFVEALNRLAEAGVAPENIKVIDNWIYYFHDEDVDDVKILEKG